MLAVIDDGQFAALGLAFLDCLREQLERRVAEAIRLALKPDQPRLAEPAGQVGLAGPVGLADAQDGQQHLRLVHGKIPETVSRKPNAFAERVRSVRFGVRGKPRK